MNKVNFLLSSLLCVAGYVHAMEIVEQTTALSQPSQKKQPVLRKDISLMPLPNQPLLQAPRPKVASQCPVLVIAGIFTLGTTFAYMCAATKNIPLGLASGITYTWGVIAAGARLDETYDLRCKERCTQLWNMIVDRQDETITGTLNESIGKV